MKYPAYKSNKNTGLSWVPTAPAHWQIKRLRFMLDTINPTGAEIELADDADVSFIPMNAVGEFGELDLSLTKPLNEIGSGYTYIREGDVVVAKITPCFENGKGAVAEGLTNGVAFGTTELHVLRSGPEMNNRFLFFLTASSLFRELGEGEMYGAGGQKRVPEDFIKDLLLPYPPLDEQHAIVTFLNEQTVRLDALLDRQKCLLRLLAEKRTALITQAVTQGLDAAVPRRPSGMGWLGEVPAHWRVKRLKYILAESLKYGANEVAEYEDPSHPRFVRITDVKPNGKLKDETFKSLPPEVAEPFLLKEGDILLARSGATVGKNFKYEKSWGTAAFAGYLIRARLDKSVMADFVTLFLSSHIYWEWIKSIFIQATIQNVSAEKYAYLQIPIPPLAEQETIAKYVRPALKQIDKTIATAEKAIKKLQEYRAALITAAVTGQIDVRAAVTAEAV